VPNLATVHVTIRPNDTFLQYHKSRTNDAYSYATFRADSHNFYNQKQHVQDSPSGNKETYLPLDNASPPKSISAQYHEYNPQNKGDTHLERDYIFV
jgi:hypothetical protein